MNAVEQALATTTPIDEIKRQLTASGWVLLRGEGYTLPTFSELMGRLCSRLTFDPAREYATRETQKVDAGNDPVGLHIENGNTPMPPDIVAFHSDLSASQGAETTICDGAAVYRAMPRELRARFAEPMTVTRYLPKLLWQRYVANALGLDNPEAVNWSQLQELLQMVPGQSAEPSDHGGIDYTLTFAPVREDNLLGTPAFANALLGPSYNYEPPVYRFADGAVVSDELLHALRELCEQLTEEIRWRDGDVAVIDNKRFMHGRRHIPVPLSERRLYIGMGSTLRTQ